MLSVVTPCNTLPETSLDLCIRFYFNKPHFSVDSWQLSWWFTHIRTDGWSVLQSEGCYHIPGTQWKPESSCDRCCIQVCLRFFV